MPNDRGKKHEKKIKKCKEEHVMEISFNENAIVQCDEMRWKYKDC